MPANESLVNFEKELIKNISSDAESFVVKQLKGIDGRKNEQGNDFVDDRQLQVTQSCSQNGRQFLVKKLLSLRSFTLILPSLF